MKAHVTTLVYNRFYGFIRDETGQDYFFHGATDLADGLRYSDLQSNDPVEFETKTTPKGLRAINVRRAQPQGVGGSAA